MSTGEKSVAAAYVVIFAAVLASVVIIAFRFGRIEQKVASLTDARSGREVGKPDEPSSAA